MDHLLYSILDAVKEQFQHISITEYTFPVCTNMMILNRTTSREVVISIQHNIQTACPWDIDASMHILLFQSMYILCDVVFIPKYQFSNFIGQNGFDSEGS
jgi:hypothetical protein